MPDTQAPLLHSIENAAIRLGVSPSTVWRLIRERQLRTVRIRGRTLVADSELVRLSQPDGEHDGANGR
jgi:excisionase family DNA binding protein